MPTKETHGLNGVQMKRVLGRHYQLAENRSKGSRIIVEPNDFVEVSE